MTPTKLIIITFSMIMTIASNAQNMVSLAEVCDAVIEKGMKYVVLEDYKGVVFTQGMAELGVAFAGKTPACHVRCIKERKEDIAWENDRVSFRIYSREVKGKVSSGVDFWTKNVAHPVVEAWYALNDKGMDYHTDRGEGYDFYAVGRNRGVGGTGIMSAAGLVAPEPYANYRIYNDTPDLVDFEISYQPYEADGRMIYEKKRIRMVLSTHFYQVTSTIETSDGSDATLAVGLTDFGAAQVEKSAEKGKLSLIEKISDKDGSIGCAVFVDPVDVKGFAESGKDRLILLGVKSGEPVTYYVGAGWSKDTRFDPSQANGRDLSKGPRMINYRRYISLPAIISKRKSNGVIE